MGDAAMSLAISHLESRRGNAAVSPGLQAALDLKDHYGLLNECVDHFLHPEKMFAFAWRPGPEHEAKSSETARNVLPDGAPGNKLPEELIKHCTHPSWLTRAQAAHSNHLHFQQDMVISIRLYHAFAVSVSHTEGNPYTGLLLNAISDHFLQDYFAPGHLTAPRTRLTDLPATAMHDLANRMGAVFQPDPSTLGEVLDYLCGAREGQGTAGVCTPPKEVTAAIKGIGLNADQLTQAVHDIRKKKPLHFRGDGQLHRAAQAGQRTLLLATQMRSILDVIESTPEKQNADSTAENSDDGKWTNNLRAFLFRYDLRSGRPTSDTPFGRYRFDLDGEVTQALKDAELPKEDSSPPRQSTTQSSVFDICSFGQCDRDLYRMRTRSPVVSLSFQRESESRGMHEARNVWALEISPFGRYYTFPMLGITTGVEVAPTFGYLRNEHGKRSGEGPSLRLPFYVPETEIAVGPYARWLKHTTSTQDARKWSYGLRVDAGFSTYLTFFLGYGMDYANDSKGGLVRTDLWTAGARIGMPLTRVPWLNSTRD
jgi:hypothetical protein